MSAVTEPMVLLLAGWSSGISVYLTAALLGVAGRMGWIALPGGLDAVQNPFLIALAIALYGVEFVADKVPYVDSAWDSVHTAIRPLGASLMGYMAGSEHGPVLQMGYAMLTGTVALNMHALKATSRLAINTSPEPFSNIAASTAENTAVFAMYWLFVKHPVIACLLIVAILIAAFFLIRLLWRFAKKVFGTVFGLFRPRTLREAAAHNAAAAPPLNAPASGKETV
jgi:hypothetical protein